MASLASRLTKKRANSHTFKTAKPTEYNPKLAEERDRQLAQEEAKRKKLREELGLSSGSEADETDTGDDTSDDEESSEYKNPATRRTGSTEATSDKNNTVPIQVYQQLHKDYTIALDDVHTIAERERETQALLDKLMLMSKNKAAILKEKMYQKLRSKDILLKDMYVFMLEMEKKRRDLMTEEQLLLSKEKTVEQYYKEALSKESKRTSNLQISPAKGGKHSSDGTVQMDTEELQMKLASSQKTRKSLSAEIDILRQHIANLGENDASSLALIREEIDLYQAKLVHLKSEHNSVTKERETTQLALSAAMASSTRLKENTEQLKREKIDILNEINTHKQEKEEQEMKAKAMLKEAQRLTTLSNDINRENENMRVVLKEAQQEILSLKAAILTKDSRIKSLQSQIPDEATLKRQANALELEEFKQRWKDAESKAMDANSEKRAKIKSMNVILEQIQAKLNEKEKVLEEKLSEVELLKGQVTAQSIEINAKNDENFQFKNDLSEAKQEVERNKKLLQESVRAQDEMKYNLEKKYESKYDAIIKEMQRNQLELKELLQNEIKVRRKLHKKVMEYEGNIRVYCRIRPPNKTDLSVQSGEDGAIVITTNSDKEDGIVNIDAELHGTKTRSIHSQFEFDAGFRPESTQNEVFERVEPFIVSAMDGYNCCIFAYGQTGSGKTFTMQGPLDNRGVNVRSLNAMFSEAKLRLESFNTIYNFKISMCEIYNEECYDLLGDNGENGIRPKVKLRQADKQKVFAEGLSIIEVNSVEDIEKIIKLGQENRSVGSHNFNEHSSRSHLVVTVYIEQSVPEGKARDNNKAEAGKMSHRTSLLHLIDLAGSERLDKTGASGDRLREAQSINKSLSALGDVIAALGHRQNGKGKQKHVPYRNSKLTWLLSNSLNGNSKVLMLVCVSPTLMCTNESMCSLQFAQRCRNTKLGMAKKV